MCHSFYQQTFLQFSDNRCWQQRAEQLLSFPLLRLVDVHLRVVHLGEPGHGRCDVHRHQHTQWNEAS